MDSISALPSAFYRILVSLKSKRGPPIPKQSSRHTNHGKGSDAVDLRLLAFLCTVLLHSVVWADRMKFPSQHHKFSPRASLRGWKALALLICLQLPPSARLAMGQLEALKQDCMNASESEKCFHWVDDVQDCDYGLATRIFETIETTMTASSDGDGTSKKELWFPKLDASKEGLNRFVDVLASNSERLGGLRVELSSWPKTPATLIKLWWPSPPPIGEQEFISNESSISSAVRETEIWVEETLCRLALCPYTASMQRAAVGLESVGVKEGPIIIRHACTSTTTKTPMDASYAAAAITANAFWKGVSELASKSEEDVATFLIVAPSWYDNEFLEFSRTFDDLIEASVQATRAETIVGRAVFHPRYDSALIGHSEVLPGHALPARMVAGFVEKYLSEDEERVNLKSGGHETTPTERIRPNLEAIAKANDAVRWTPHATLNLLRRSQLKASKVAEAESAKSRPNWIYARNVLRILKQDTR